MKFRIPTALFLCNFFHFYAFATGLSEYINASKNNAIDSKIADTALNVAISQRNSGYWALAPQPFASVAWNRNQFESTNEIFKPNGLQETKITSPLRSRDVTLGVKMPLVDIPAWYRILGAQDNVSAEQARKNLAQNQVTQRVIELYLQVITNQSLLETAQQSLRTAALSRKSMQDRNRLGVASSADLGLAVAQELSASANVNEAQSALTLASSRLQALSGMPVEKKSLGAVSLEPEKPLTEWDNEGAIASNPKLVAAKRDALASQQQLRQSQSELFPKLNAQIARKWTDNPVVQYSPQWAASLNLEWTPSFYAIANAQTQAELAQRAALQTDRTSMDLRLEILQHWQQVGVNLSRVKAAAAKESAQKLELDFANQKFTSGTSTASKLLESEKDYFLASLEHIQARANLVMSRLVLRLTASASLDGVVP